jgi:hypothetical protein
LEFCLDPRYVVEIKSEQEPIGKMDGFLILNYLEHVPYPRKFLTAIRSKMEDTGAAIIEVPNFDMIREHNMDIEYTLDHLTYFGVKELKAFIESCGFEYHSHTIEFGGYIISMFVTTKRQDGTKTHVEIVTEWLKKYGEKDVLVWGAGHQSLSILSQIPAEYIDRIDCIVDSSEAKHGAIAPGTKLQILPPPKYNTHHTAILIIAGGYSDEIKNTITRDCMLHKTKLAILSPTGIEEVL